MYQDPCRRQGGGVILLVDVPHVSGVEVRMVMGWEPPLRHFVTDAVFSSASRRGGPWMVPVSCIVMIWSEFLSTPLHGLD